MVSMTGSEGQNSNPAMAHFALGHADASLSFLKLLTEDVAAEATSILALRVLGALWAQYRIDCKINHGRTLLSIDNGYELRVFTSLVDELATWPPLLAANALVRAHSPALSVDENRLYEAETDDKRSAVLEVCDHLSRLPDDLDPIKRAGVLIDRCQKLEEHLEYGICWALNLAGAIHLDFLGRSKASAPFPALFRREMLRFDRSTAWRDELLCNALTGSAHMLSEAVSESIHAVHTFRAKFPDLRRNSRLGLAYVYVSGIGDLSPALLARLIECSEPGARKMLRQLASGGLAVSNAPSPSFERVRNFRLGWSGALWLRAYSVADPAHYNPFDDD